MTTKVHVVNFGPDVIVVHTAPPHEPAQIYPQQSNDFYVWDGQDVVIKEVKIKQENT